MPDLLEEREPTPYELSKRSDARISMSTACRLKRRKGLAHTVDAEPPEARCDVLMVEPGELLERDNVPKKRGRAA